MRNLSDGERHAINDICDSWVMTIIEISGGIGNIPTEKKHYIRDIQNICISEFNNYLKNNDSKTIVPDFWHFWKIEHPEFYNFESFSIYNPDPEKAKQAVKRAMERFADYVK